MNEIVQFGLNFDLKKEEIMEKNSIYESVDDKSLSYRLAI